MDGIAVVVVAGLLLLGALVLLVAAVLGECQDDETREEFEDDRPAHRRPRTGSRGKRSLYSR